MATSTSFLFRCLANGIRNVKTGVFRPFISDSFTPGTILDRKVNVRYYIKSVTFSLASLVTDAGTSATLTGNVDLQSRTLARVSKTTLLADKVDVTVPVNVLLDKEATLTFTAADITTASVTVVYAEVFDLE